MIRHAIALPTNYSSDLKNAALLQWWRGYHQAHGLNIPTVKEGASEGLRDPLVYPRMWLMACIEQHWESFTEWVTEETAQRVRTSSAVSILTNVNTVVLHNKPFLLILEPKEMSRADAERFARGWWGVNIGTLSDDLAQASARTPQLVA